MPTPGTLTKANVGFSMPGHAPLYPRPPYRYQGASLLVFEYLTDAVSAARMLPAQAVLPDLPQAPGKAVAALVFATYPATDLGPYQEAVQFLVCEYQGHPVQFATHLYVTSDAAMAAGREMGGYPKKIARIRIDHDHVRYRAALDRPAGQLLASATLTDLQPPEPVEPAESLLKYLTLRIIPSPTRDAPPTFSELLLSDWQIVNGQEQKGTGVCKITGTSMEDPIHFAPIQVLLESKLIRADLVVNANDPDPARNQPF